MGLAEFITAGIAIAKIAPDLIDSIKVWAATGHEPTDQEIADLETRYQLNSQALRDRIAAAKAREAGQ